MNVRSADVHLHTLDVAAPSGPVVVDAKLRTPKPRSDHLPRPELVGRLREAPGPVVVVRAGAGYGKTTTVRQWIDDDPRPAAWVTLDAGDNDPVVLLRHVVRALGRLSPLSAVEDLLVTEPPPVERGVLPELAQALADGRPPSILVLDDVHLVGSTASGEFLAWLVAVLPAGWTLALVGRAMPQMHLARLVVNHHTLVLRREDLAFSPAECAAVASHTLPAMTADQAAELFEATEGWPAGLYLSLLAIKAAPVPEVVLAGLATSARDLNGYFHEELLRNIDTGVRSFLVGTSVLDRLSGPLCDAVLERRDSAVRLQALSASDNLFVIALDDAPEAYRYHNLFADLLLAELRRSAPDEEAGLRVRAAHWLSDHDEPDAAVDHALAASERALAAEIAGRHGVGFLQSGRIDTVERWLARFADEELREDPLLCLLAGWADLVRGRGDAVVRWLEVSEALDADGPARPGPLPDGTHSLQLARATLAMVHGGGGVKATGANAQAVLDAGPDGSPWWTTARLLAAQAAFLADPSADMVGLAEDAEFATRGHPATHALALAHVAAAHFLRGPAGQGQRAAAAAVAELRAHHLEEFSLTLFVHAVHAWDAARRGASTESSEAASKAGLLLEGIGAIVPRGQCQARLALAEAALLRREDDTAARLVAEAASHLGAEPDAAVLWEWTDRLQATVGRRRREARRLDRVGLTDAERRVLGQLPTHRSLEEIGEVLYVSRNTVKTHAVSIYRKLGVSGRSAAVARAATLGLLDQDGLESG